MSRPPPPDIDLLEGVRRLESGRLPTRAEDRLRNLAGPTRKLFTSALSVNEFLVAREVGLTPIAQVMGCSLYHIGVVGDYGSTGEIESISAAHREARRRALHRLLLEATLVDCDLVVSVRLTDRSLTKEVEGGGGNDGVIEFTALGTAVKAPWLPRRAARPVLTDLSGQDVWALARDGWAPCGVVFDFCRYHVHHVLGNHQADRPGGEIREATHAVERARELVARRVLEQATKLGAELVVGSNVRVSAAEVPCGRSGGCSLHDFEVDLSWFGTGIRRMPEAAVARSAERIPPLILGMMPLGRRADPGQTS